jgi:alcohol dehydrogenase
MKAVVYEAFGERPAVCEVADPAVPTSGVVIRLGASGVCRSDWHGWCGHDPTIRLPHVPGHELAGTIEAIGSGVRNWRPGDRVTVPFVGGCGACSQCRSGNQQVCVDQFQPGFTHWGSFAEFVAIEQADLNLVAVPESMEFATAAGLGCRFVTSYRAVVDQGRVQAGEWLAIHGCGGIGLSAIMIGLAAGARVIAIDVSATSLEAALALGAEHAIDATTADVPAVVHDLSDGGVHVSIDCLGIIETCTNSVRSLRRRGRHVQVGWMLGDHSAPPIPMDLVMGHELEIIGSHGMPAHRYGDMMGLIAAGVLEPQRLIHETIDLDASVDALVDFDRHDRTGLTVVTDFG